MHWARNCLRTVCPGPVLELLGAGPAPTNGVRTPARGSKLACATAGGRPCPRDRPGASDSGARARAARAARCGAAASTPARARALTSSGLTWAWPGTHCATDCIPCQAVWNPDHLDENRCIGMYRYIPIYSGIFRYIPVYTKNWISYLV